jgi:hypothetical protein
MNPDYTVLFLDRAKYKVFFRRQFSLAAPSDGVAAKRAIKISGVELIEQRFQVEILSLVGKLKLALDREPFD